MNRFNLTFRGEIVEGHDPEQAKASLGRLLGINDATRLQRFFTGDPVILRRNLERKEAAELYARLRRLGMHAELVKIGERGDLHAGESISTPAPRAAGTDAKTGGRPGPDQPPRAAQAPAESEPAQVTKPAAAAGAAPAKVVAKEIKPAEAASRRVDQAAEKKLQAEDAAQLKTREKALKKALRAKKKTEARRARASERAREKTLAREAQHQATIEAAKRKAMQAEKKRIAEAEAAQRRAEQDQREAEAAAERVRAAAEEAARLAAVQAERERLEAEQKVRAAAAEAARLAEEKRKAEQQAARLLVENARRKREQAEEAARRKAEEVRRRAEEQARQQAEREEQAAQRRAMEEQAVQRAAVELAQRPALKPMGARVKTRLEMPSLRRSPGKPASRRQAGAPNLYNLRPFRNTPEIRARAERSRASMRHAFTAAAVAIALVIALAARLLSLPPPSGPDGASAIAIAPPERPLLLADGHLILHDRAGVSVSDLSLESLGLAKLSAPMVFDAAGNLLAPGRLLDGPEPAAPAQAASPMVRCQLAESRCELFAPALSGTVVSALAVHPLDGSLFIADASAGELLRVGPEGAILARAPALLPPRPVLRLDSGLLLVNSALGAAISVFRYEASAFGKQLDEILLLPDPDQPERFTGVRDFLWSGDHWWAILESADGGRPGLYRFDTQWQAVDSPALAAGTQPLQLVKWGARILVTDPARVPIQRFNGEGDAEAPMISAGLSDLVAKNQRVANLEMLGWRIGLALSLLAAIAGICLGGLHRLRSLVYTSCRERGAEPVDELGDSIDWMETASDRTARLGRTTASYAALAVGLVLGAMGLGVSALQLCALLFALAGPAAALLILQRSDPGHIGVTGRQLLLVDHEGVYHLGGGGRIHYRGPFLMIDDVAVFTGTRLLPAFAPEGIQQYVMPVAVNGIKVDRRIVTVKLLQGRHPLALGAVVTMASVAFGLAILSLHGIF